MPAILRPTRLLPLLLLLALAGGFAWRYWQGPLLPGYRLETRPLVQRVVASGSVDSQSLARIGSEITGTVSARHVREGDVVKLGDLLIELDDSEPKARVAEAEAALAQLQNASRPQAEAALREARSNFEQARRERERRTALAERRLLSSEQLEQARRAEVSTQAALNRAELSLAALAEDGSETRVLRQRLAAARATLARTRIHAHSAGIVQSRDVEPGDLVQPGRVLLQIAHADSREILLPLDEKILAPVQPGQQATVIADAYPERPLTAQVAWLEPGVNAARGTLDVHLQLLENEDFLRQGMTVSVSIETGRREQALALPNDALLHIEQDHAQVLRLDAGGRVEPVTVRLGLRGAALSEVIDGLSAGDQVLAAPADAGQRVRLALQPLPAGGGL